MASYDKAGVTMMDHHAASNSFDKFETIESELGRTVHADWTWIVPPLRQALALELARARRAPRRPALDASLTRA